MNQDRIKKLESVCRNVISEVIFENKELLSDFGIVTITEIKISSDLSYLDVFVSSITNPESLTKALAKNNHLVEHKLGKKVQIRKLPKVRYRYDGKGKVGQDICNTLQKESKKYL